MTWLNPLASPPTAFRPPTVRRERVLFACDTPDGPHDPPGSAWQWTDES